jgi:alpha-galactosidase
MTQCLLVSHLRRSLTEKKVLWDNFSARSLRMKRSAILGVFLILAQVTMFGQTNMTGYWKYSVPNGGTSYMQLKQVGETVTSVSGKGTREGLTGTLHDGKLHLQGTPGPNMRRAPAVYDAVVKGDKFPIRGTNPNGEIADATLERVTREDMYPERLPLPVLRDLPDTGLVRTPPMGWNSWNHYHDHFDDATVRQTADALVASGMSKVGYTYIIVDEGWSSGRDANGNIVGNARFPDMKALADYVHSKGLKIGIYSSPGPRVCGGYEGSYGHEEQDAKTFAGWGYDYLKYDWCGARSIYDGTPAELQGAYQKMGEALQKTGRPIVYSLCEYGMGDVWKWGGKTGGNLWRTTGDIADNWQSMERNGFAQLDITQFSKPGQWNDPDMLEVGNGGMTSDEYRTHMSLWALLRAPLIAGNDLRSMTDETKSILMNTDVIAIDQDPDAKPVQVASVEGKSEVLLRYLSGSAAAVGLFNRGDQPVDISFRWDSLHLDAGLGGRQLSAQDLWKHESVKIDGDTFTANVPKHGVVLLKLTSARVMR